jgi:hypothetical protein
MPMTVLCRPAVSCAVIKRACTRLISTTRTIASPPDAAMFAAAMFADRLS